MRALVVGGAGFVGRYLTGALAARGFETHATTLSDVRLPPQEGVAEHVLDITEPQEVRRLLRDLRPDRIFHLAAQSSVRLSWEQPRLTAEVNALGAVNLFEAVKEECPSARVLVVGSGEEYGNADYSVPVRESVPAAPRNVYALTKLFQEQLAGLYAEAYGLSFVATRSFNHFGPYQSTQFVVADFCSQAAAIEKNLREPVIRVGNLAAYRDFTDVRDVVEAYLLLAEKGERGEVYNVGSGKCLSIGEILGIVLSLCARKIEVRVDESKFRPIDVPRICADVTKIKALGWEPKIPVRQTVSDTLDHFRERS